MQKATAKHKLLRPAQAMKKLAVASFFDRTGLLVRSDGFQHSYFTGIMAGIAHRLGDPDKAE